MRQSGVKLRSFWQTVSCQKLLQKNKITKHTPIRATPRAIPVKEQGITMFLKRVKSGLRILNYYKSRGDHIAQQIVRDRLSYIIPFNAER